MSLGESKRSVSVRPDIIKLSEILQHLSALKSCHAGCIFYGEICQRMFFPPQIFIFMRRSWIHHDFCILCTSGGRQVIEQRGCATLCACLLPEQCFLQKCPSRRPPRTSRKIQTEMVILSAVLKALIFTLSHRVPLIRAWTGRWTSFHEPSGREQELVRLNMQQAAHVGDMQLPTHFRGNSNLFKISPLVWNLCARAGSSSVYPLELEFKGFISWLVAPNQCLHRQDDEIQQFKKGNLGIS